ncbi:MAG TPA: DNA-formamidopyrimidine glycosylase family protein [Candidatus Krumholzibacteria bacterium]
MPELPDIELYLHALRPRIGGRRLQRVRVRSPFLLRSHDPRLGEAEGRSVLEHRRLGKRIVFVLEGDLFLVLHLMIAGRLDWQRPGASVPKKHGLAAFDFANGTLLLREASLRKRAGLWLVRGEAELSRHDPGGLELLGSRATEFSERLRANSHTLKRALSDPTLFSGIGNAFSDEILHRAQLSPFALTGRIGDEECARLHRACVDVLSEWAERLIADCGEAFPKKVTAFRPEMNVHGKYGQPCPRCEQPVQRIVHASNETNYCPGCQTDGKIYADRSLSRLLGKDWPRNLDELDEFEARYRKG